MDFKCYLCDKEFNNLNDAINHLKKSHRITDNTCKIKCLVSHNGCVRQYNSFKTMRAHAVLCVENRKSAAVNTVMLQFTNEFQGLIQLRLVLSSMAKMKNRCQLIATNQISIKMKKKNVSR